MKNLFISVFLFLGLVAHSHTYAGVLLEYNISFDDDLYFQGSSIPSGSKFQILDISPDDSYYSNRAEIIGKTGKTISSLDLDNEGYTSGSIKTDDGKSYYFFKVKLGKIANGRSLANSSFITGVLNEGAKVYLVDISPEDAYYSDLSKYLGKKGTVSKGSMTMKEDGFYA